jgi:O-antigen/teichoic acid export membrane protein
MGVLQLLLRRMKGVDDATQHVITVLAGHSLRLILGLASSAMLARGLGPEGLSTFSVVSAAMLIAISMSDFGLGNSAVRFMAGDLKEQPSRAYGTASTFARLRLLGSLILVVFSMLFAGPLASILGLPASGGVPFVRLAALGVLATSCSAVVSTILRALRFFPRLVVIQTLNVVLTVMLLGVLFLLGRLTIAGALVVGAVTALAAAIAGWFLQPPVWRHALRASAPLFGADARRLWRFGRWLWISNILVIALSQLDLLLLNRWSNPQATGYYALALNLALKAAILNQTLHTVLLPDVSALRGWDQFVTYIRRSLSRSALLAFLLILILPIARPFIVTVYGQPFAPSVPLFYLLIGVILFDILVDPLLMLAYPLDMTRHIAASYVVRVATMVLVGSLVIPSFGGQGAALAKLAANVLGALFLGGLLFARLRRARRATTEGAR